MPAKNPRVNVTFEEKTAHILSSLANHEHKSMASLVRELALEALEMREDLFLSDIARKLDKKDAKRHKHDDVWK